MDAGGKEGKLLCCKRIFDWIKANLAEIQLKKHQNVQKMHFLQKVAGVNGLSVLAEAIFLEGGVYDGWDSAYVLVVDLRGRSSVEI